MEIPARTNYIFVDYENVQELDLDLIAGKSVKVILVVGSRQKSTPLALTKQIHKFHDQVEVLETETTGRNALDLVLAFHIGKRAQIDPEGYFHILSKDKDFDALVKHLRAIDVRATRDEAFNKISALVSIKSMTLLERTNWVLERMAKNKVSQPKSKKSLLKNIHALCRKEISEVEAEQILNRLVALKMVELKDNVVTKIAL